MFAPILFSFIIHSYAMELFIEKNDNVKIESYRRKSYTMTVETPAINFATKLVSRNIAEHVFDGQIKDFSEELMLYAYSPNQGLYLYTIHVLNSGYNKTGPVKRFNHDATVPDGYRVAVTNKKELDIEFIKNGFVMFGADVNKLKNELVSEKAALIAKKIADKKMRWEKAPWGWKMVDALWKIAVIVFIISRIL